MTASETERPMRERAARRYLAVTSMVALASSDPVPWEDYALWQRAEALRVADAVLAEREGDTMTCWQRFLHLFVHCRGTPDHEGQIYCAKCGRFVCNARTAFSRHEIRGVDFPAVLTIF